MITIRIERDKTRANFARAAAGPQLPVRQRSDKRQRDHSWTHIKQVGHRGALRLNSCRAATELHATKNDASASFLSWFSGLVISYRETKLLFASGEMIQLQLANELILVSRAAPSHACEARRVENRRLSNPTIPPPAPPLQCAGTSGERPDLSADDWTAPSAPEPVAAAAIGSVVGSFANAAMRLVPQQDRNN